MRLLVDAGNTRVKWQLRNDDVIVRQGVGAFGPALFNDLAGLDSSISGVAVSTVVSEQKRIELSRLLARHIAVPPQFYWAEAERGGLVNAYATPERMGADRWHGMYGAWKDLAGGFAVIDAGSAVTVDYVDDSGRHLGGYILPGRGMMLRSLKNDAARIGFEDHEVSAGDPGASTTECVHHGLFWLWQAMASRIHRDCHTSGINTILVTGGDAAGIQAAGLQADLAGDLVLAGLAAIDAEEQAAS